MGHTVWPNGWTVYLMDGNRRLTMIIFHRWTEMDSRTKTDRPSHGPIQCLNFRRRTIKNIKMWTEVDGWTDGQNSVRRGLSLNSVFPVTTIDYEENE